MFLSTFWEVLAAMSIVLFIWVPIIMLWGYALADLFMRRDIRWRKVLWLLGILIFPLLGPIVYLIIRPDEETRLGITREYVSPAAMEEGYRPS